MLKQILLKHIGRFLHTVHNWYEHYEENDIVSKLGGGKIFVYQPFKIAGEKNITIHSPASIGPGSTLYTTGAKLIIGSHFIAGPNLTIITGDHKYIPGRFLDSISGKEKEPGVYDKDVIIGKDVWVGANVTILKGCHIGDSSIVAAGSLVIGDVPPFAIVGGVPAKVIKYKWTEEERTIHKVFLDNEQ